MQLGKRTLSQVKIQCLGSVGRHHGPVVFGDQIDDQGDQNRCTQKQGTVTQYREQAVAGVDGG